MEEVLTIFHQVSPQSSLHEEGSTMVCTPAHRQRYGTML